MNAYRNAEIEYRERCKARIQRQLEISEKSLCCIRYCVVSLNVLCHYCLFSSISCIII